MRITPFSSRLQVLQLTVQGLLVHVAEDVVIHLHHRRQRALAEAGHRAQGDSCRSGVVTQSLSAPLLAFVRQPQFQAQALQQVARAARVAGGAAADADGVLALRLQVEQRVEGDHAVDLRQGNIGLLGDVFQDFGGKVFVRMMFLQALQDSEQFSGLAGMRGDGAVRETLLFERERSDWPAIAAMTPPIPSDYSDNYTLFYFTGAGVKPAASQRNGNCASRPRPSTGLSTRCHSWCGWSRGK